MAGGDTAGPRVRRLPRDLGARWALLRLRGLRLRRLQRVHGGRAGGAGGAGGRWFGRWRPIRAGDKTPEQKPALHQTWAKS